MLTHRWMFVFLALIITLCVIVAPATQAATWQGGDGEWTSTGVDNWGLGVGAYPGDGTNDAETHSVGASTVAVQAGDSISTLKIILLNGSTLNMSGGTLLSQSRLQVYNSGDINFTGGTITGDTDVRILDGCTITVDGGELGTRLDGIDGVAPPNDSLVSFYGSSTLRITEDGILDINRLQWDLLGSGDTGVAVFEGVISSGGTYDRLALYLDIFDADAAAATIKFIFSSEGLTPLTQFSNNGLNIGTASRLEVDVSELKDDGTTDYTLIKYTGAIQGTGTFASIAITDDIHGTLTLGTQGALDPGEYHLDYTGGDGSDIVITFNNSALSSYWDFEEGTGLTAADSVGNNDGTLDADGARLGPDWVTDTPTASSYALQFNWDGSGEYSNLFKDVVDCGTANELALTGDFTIEAWVKSEVNGEFQGIYTKMPSTGPLSGVCIGKRSDNYFQFVVADGVANTGYVYSDSAYTDTNWHHIFAVRDNGVNRMYIDGVLQTDSNTVTPAYTANTHSIIGQWYTNVLTLAWLGMIDEVRVYKRALSAEEMGATLAAVTVSATDAAAAEQASDTGTFRVSRGSETTGALVVNYSISGTSASDDYSETLSGSVTISDGNTYADITITPVDDSANEGDETVILTVTTGTGYTVDTPNAATVTITDNDTPTITISATDDIATEESTDIGTFRVSRGTKTSGALAVSYSVTGTAADADYSETLSGSVTIADGNTDADITITPVDDVASEGSETVILTVTTGSSYYIGTPNAATVGIIDNDETAVTAQTPTDCAIVLPTTADSTQLANANTAANELQKHLELITDVTVGIYNDDSTVMDKYRFYVGNWNPSAPEQSAQYTVGDTMTWFSGNSAGNLDGSSVAVYAFLEEQLGVRWVEPGDIGIMLETDTLIQLTPATGSWQPTLEMRKIRSGTKTGGWTDLSDPGHYCYEFRDFNRTSTEHDAYAQDVTTWQQRMRMGSHTDVEYGHAFTNWWNLYGTSNPEYFALNKYGEREPETADVTAVKLCVSNPDVVTQIIANWQAAGTKKWVNVCENDQVWGWCQCTSCMALDAPLGGETFGDHLTDRYVYLANEVAKAAKLIRSDAGAVMYAYQWSLEPPRSETVEPNVVVLAVPLSMDSTYVSNLFGGWETAGAQYLGLRPNWNLQYMSSIIPTGIEEAMYDSFQTANTDFDLLLTDYDSMTELWKPNGLADYVLAKTFSDPTKSYTYWEDEYCEAFGNASADVKAYYAHWRSFWNTTLAPNHDTILSAGLWSNWSRGLIWTIDTYYDESDFNTAIALLEAGEAETLTTTQRAKLEQMILAAKHAKVAYKAFSNRYTSDRLATADALFAWRTLHKDDLDEHNWISMFATEQIFGDQGSQKIAQYCQGYDQPWLQTAVLSRFKIDPTNVGLTDVPAWMDIPYTTIDQSWGTPGAWDCLRTDLTYWENPYQDGEWPHDSTRTALEDYDGVGWYRSQIKVPSDWDGTRTIYLAFNGVGDDCYLYFNGQLVGSRIWAQAGDGGAHFAIDITSAIDWTDKGAGVSQNQQIAVRVNDRGMESGGGIHKPFFLVSHHNVSVSATDAAAAEEATDPGTFRISRGTGDSGDLTVNYSITGTADASDYSETLSGSVTITDGNTYADITITPVDDGDIESNETVILTVTSGTGYGIGTPSAATVTITDNDEQIVSISATDASAAEAASDTGTFRVSRGVASSGVLGVNYTVTGTASSADYSETLSGSVNIADGNTYVDITITPVDDTLLDAGETVILTVTTGTGYVVGSPSSDTVTITDDEVIRFQQGVVSSVGNTGWTTVTLDESYTSMVVVCTPNYDSSTVALVARVQNASGNSFDVRLDRTDGSATAISGNVYYFVVEEGVYTSGTHGVTMEAVKYTSTVTDGKSNFNGKSQTYSNSYTSPVVLGQVMTYNDSNFSAFWSRGASRTDIPSNTVLYTGKQIGEDTPLTRSNETIGYIVIESGSGSLNSLDYVTAVGADTVKGVGDSPAYAYTLSGLSSTTTAVISQVAMDGNNGSWGILYGSSPVSTTALNLAVDEDQANDAERNHTAEQIAYIVFED